MFVINNGNKGLLINDVREKLGSSLSEKCKILYKAEPFSAKISQPPSPLNF